MNPRCYAALAQLDLTTEFIPGDETCDAEVMIYVPYIAEPVAGIQVSKTYYLATCWNPNFDAMSFGERRANMRHAVADVIEQMQNNGWL